MDKIQQLNDGRMQTEDVKEALRYNMMMEKAAAALSVSVAYGNFTNHTYTKYIPTVKQAVNGRKAEDMEESCRRFVDEIHPEDRGKFLECFSTERLQERLQQGEHEIYGEFRRVRDGKYCWISFRCIPIENLFDEDELCVFVVRDINVRKQMEQQQYRIYTEGIIDTLSSLVEFRDLDSGQHIKRTKALTKILLLNLRRRKPGLGLTDASIEKISEAAALHDVGKIAISDTILNKPGRLTEEEFEEMKKHTVKGYEILKALNLSQDEEQQQYSLDISRHHHERWDGMGYPDHLKGDEIPLWSQVVSIVDVYDALVSPRVYKKAYSHETALQMILNGDCGCFNPELLECLKDSVELLEQEYGRSA